MQIMVDRILYDAIIYNINREKQNGNKNYTKENKDQSTRRS